MGCEVRRAPATVELPFPPRHCRRWEMESRGPGVGWGYALRLSYIARPAVWLHHGCKHHFISSMSGFQKEAAKGRGDSLKIFDYLIRTGQVRSAHQDCPVP